MDTPKYIKARGIWYETAIRSIGSIPSIGGAGVGKDIYLLIYKDLYSRTIG